ncbi:hypothetical protein KIW84_033988 [Lathyrus oleraceus]|uniref:Uncharacterized protein n=1 Tax=Pisum sativum TaxID=3888 RepID=A0A9D5B4K1_PEA|nr:hypothetical protein KIW84_033988 [Pisum sativum]
MLPQGTSSTVQPVIQNAMDIFTSSGTAQAAHAPDVQEEWGLHDHLLNHLPLELLEYQPLLYWQSSPVQMVLMISIENMMGSCIPFMIRPKKEQFDSDSDSGMLDFPEVPKASVQPSANFATTLDRVIPPAVMPHLKVDFHSSSHFG